MKRVVIFGAAGRTGKYLTRKMQSLKDVELSVFVRNPQKFEGMDLNGVRIITGDALKSDEVSRRWMNRIFCSAHWRVMC